MSDQKPEPELYKILGLFLFTLVLLSAYSFAPKQYSLFGFKVRQSKIKNFFNEPGKKPLVAAADTSKEAQEKKMKVDSTSQKFLFIGDSMLEYLRIRLNDYAKKNGHSVETVIWYSSSSLWYGTCDTLKHFIDKYEPTYVVVSLGANELFIKDIKTDRDTMVQHIINQIGDRKYLWVGPPNWKDDTGINDMIVEKAGKGHYFESKKIKMKRKKDGAHPVKEDAFIWADSIAKFMMTGCDDKILMVKPDTFFDKVPHTEVLKPNPPPGL